MIVGLHGRAGSGKDACADRLEVLRGPLVRVAFATKMKQSICALLNIELAELERLKHQPNARVNLEDGMFIWSSLSFRSFLQRYGTESHRDVFGVDFWLDAALPLGRSYDDAFYAVTDVRFENERQRVYDCGGIIARVLGPEEVSPIVHVSEQCLESDWTIDNRRRDDGFASLDEQLTRLLDHLGCG